MFLQCGLATVTSHNTGAFTRVFSFGRSDMFGLQLTYLKRLSELKSAERLTSSLCPPTPALLQKHFVRPTSGCSSVFNVRAKQHLTLKVKNRLTSAVRASLFPHLFPPSPHSPNLHVHLEVL